MAVTFVSSPTNATTSNPGTASYTHSVTTSTPTTDNAIFAFIQARKTTAVTLTSATLDGVTGTIVDSSLNVDGGEACNVAVVRWKHTELPSPGAAYNLVPTWSASVLNAVTRIVQLSGVDQTTLISNFQSATATGQTASTVLGTTQNTSGAFVLTGAFTADGTSADNPPLHTAPTSATVFDFDAQGKSSQGVGYDPSAATATEDYDWTFRPESTDQAIDSLITLSFNVEAAAGGDTTPPVITLIGDTEVEHTSGDTYNDAGATAEDDVDGDITGDIVTVNSVTDFIEQAPVTYNVDDAAMNSAEEVARAVNVNPPAGFDFTGIDTPILAGDGYLGTGYTGDAPITGDQWLFEDSTTPDAFAVEVAADGLVSFVGVPTTTQTFDFYVIQADGTIGTTATFTFSVDAGEAGISIKRSIKQSIVRSIKQ